MKQPIPTISFSSSPEKFTIETTAASHGSPVEVKSSGSTKEASSSDSKLTWKRVHPTLRFRFGAVNELPYRQYEWEMIRREATFNPDILKTYDEGVSLVKGIDSQLDTLTQGLDPIVQKRVLLDLALGVTEPPKGSEQIPLRVRAILQLWKLGRDESIVPQLGNLLNSPEGDVSVATATLLANWGEVSTVDLWVSEAENSRVEDFLATLAVASTVKPLKTSDYAGGFAVEPRGQFRPELAETFIRKLGTTTSPALQMRLVSVLGLVAFDNTAAEYLLSQGASNSSLSIRTVALASLGPSIENSTIANALLAIGAGPDELMASAALKSFRYRINRESDVQSLIALLNQPAKIVKALDALETAPAKFKSLILPALEGLSVSSSDEAIKKKLEECKKILNKKRLADPK